MRSSSSTAKNSCQDDNKCQNPTNPNTTLPLSSLNPSSLFFFFKPPPPTTTSKPILNLQTIFTQSSHTFILNLHNSIHRCLTFLHLLASNKLHSLSSHYFNFCQLNCRNQRSLKSLSNHDFAAIIPGDSMAGLVVSNGISNFLNIYNTLLVVRLVLTWFPNSPPAIVSPLSTLCDPYLNIFRGLIPPLGGTLDLSPILAFLVLNALTSTAAALPAELPPAEASSSETSPMSFSTHLTTSQRKWMRRFDTIRSKGSSNVDN